MKKVPLNAPWNPTRKILQKLLHLFFRFYVKSGKPVLTRSDFDIQGRKSGVFDTYSKKKIDLSCHNIFRHSQGAIWKKWYFEKKYYDYLETQLSFIGCSILNNKIRFFPECSCRSGFCLECPLLKRNPDYNFNSFFISSNR